MRITVTQVITHQACYFTHRFKDDWLEHYHRQVVMTGGRLKRTNLGTTGPFNDPKLGEYRVETWIMEPDSFYTWYGNTLVQEWLCNSGDITFKLEGPISAKVVGTLAKNPCEGEIVPQIYVEQDGVLKSYGYLTNKTEIKVDLSQIRIPDWLDQQKCFDANDPKYWGGGVLPEPYLLMGEPPGGGLIESERYRGPNTRVYDRPENWYTTLSKQSSR